MGIAGESDDHETGSNIFEAYSSQLLMSGVPIFPFLGV